MASKKPAVADKPKAMKIVTSYTVPVRGQVMPSGETSSIDKQLIDANGKLCHEALAFCVQAYFEHWDELSVLKDGERKSAAENLIHGTDTVKAVYPEFDKRFCRMPTGIRRSIRSKALGIVSSFVSNRKNWEEAPVKTRGKEPRLGLPSQYEVTYFSTERKDEFLSEGKMQLKLYNGTKWTLYTFTLRPSDARKIESLREHRRMLSPTLEKCHGKWQLRFSFEEKKTLVQKEDPLAYRILAVDLGINAAASWCVMECDGTVHARGVFHARAEEDRLGHAINRQRKANRQKRFGFAGRQVCHVNKALSIATAQAISDVAVLYDVDCIVFEHLDLDDKKKGKSKRARLHHWRAKDVQTRVEIMAHRAGMRISRICAWGTSKLAFDGSGEVIRDPKNYSLCRFPSGKKYNCDLSASLNIGARFFLRLYAQNPDVKETIPSTPRRTYSTLLSVIRQADLLAA